MDSISRIEKLLRSATCGEPGERYCTQDECTLRAQGSCRATMRGWSCSVALRRIYFDRNNVARLKDAATTSTEEFDIEQRVGKIQRETDRREVGWKLAPEEAQIVRTFCRRHGVCIHDARMLLNLGALSIDRDEASGLKMQRFGAFWRWLDVFNGFGLALIYVFVGAIILICPITDPSAGYAAALYFFSAVMIAATTAGVFLLPALIRCRVMPIVAAANAAAHQ
jgi:hypothetical protein